ncbi:MAG: hypothetical protein J5621_01180 [Paludibacteraceae bacterium]|nr:hypothetical protein [Paludibacteraceae bacterium]
MRKHWNIWLLTLLLLTVSQVAKTQTNGGVPQYSFRSTSAYYQNGNQNAFSQSYSVPIAAQSITPSSIATQTTPPIRRGGSGGGGWGPGYDPANPGMPIGDVPWWLMVVLALVVVIRKAKQYKKNRQIVES